MGDYKKGTMTSGFNTAEMVIVLKTMPTKEAVDALSRRVLELLQQKDPSESNYIIVKYYTSLLFHDKLNVLRCHDEAY